MIDICQQIEISTGWRFNDFVFACPCEEKVAGSFQCLAVISCLSNKLSLSDNVKMTAYLKSLSSGFFLILMMIGCWNYMFISYLGMKSWDLHVCDRASTITHVDRVKKSNPWYNKIWLCLNVTIWSSQICFSVIFIHFVMIQNIWEKNCTYSHFFQSPVTASAYFWSALKAC